jgi:hypothetical protein
VRVNRDYRIKPLDSTGHIDKHSSALDIIISCARLLRTPDSMRTGGALIGALRVIFACMSSIEDGSGFWTRTEASQRDGEETCFSSCFRSAPYITSSHLTLLHLILSYITSTDLTSPRHTLSRNTSPHHTHPSRP